MLEDIHVGDEVRKIQKKPKIDGKIVFVNFGKTPIEIILPDGSDYFFVTPERPVQYSPVYAH